jgi:type IV secretion system protein TrbL
MNDVGVIDRFLDVFSRYIDSGFGLLSGEVAFLATTLIVIDVTLAALFWTWAADDDVPRALVKKTLFVGVFAYIIGNWNGLARIIFESFAGPRAAGLRRHGQRRRLRPPGRIAQVGIEAGGPSWSPSRT